MIGKSLLINNPNSLTFSGDNPKACSMHSPRYLQWKWAPVAHSWSHLVYVSCIDFSSLLWLTTGIPWDHLPFVLKSLSQSLLWGHPELRLLKTCAFVFLVFHVHLWTTHTNTSCSSSTKARFWPRAGHCPTVAARAYSQQCPGKRLTTGPRHQTSLIYSFCWSLWYSYSHHGWFHATNMSLNARLRREVHIWLSWAHRN